MKGFRVIYATDAALGIGKDGGIPWRLSGDMEYFRRNTTGAGKNAVIMGRKTYLSIPPRYRPLPQRLNVVLSRNGAHVFPGARSMTSLSEALAVLDEDSAIDNVWVAGGAGVYAEALDLTECIEVLWTQVEGEFGCNVRVPDIHDRFELVAASDFQEEDGVTYRFTVFRPKNRA